MVLRMGPRRSICAKYKFRPECGERVTFMYIYVSWACTLDPGQALMALSERLGATAGPPAISSTGVVRSGAGGASSPRRDSSANVRRLQALSSGFCNASVQVGSAPQTNQATTRWLMCGGGVCCTTNPVWSRSSCRANAASLRPTALHMQDVSDIHNEQGSEASG